MLRLGGLVLSNMEGASIRNCYCTGMSLNEGPEYGGALCRNNRGEIDSCYIVISSYSVQRWFGPGDEYKYSGSAIAGGNATSGTIRNCYYLNHSSEKMGGIDGKDVIGQAESKSESELKELAGVLGSAFKKDYDEPINDGYPILNWQ